MTDLDEIEVLFDRKYRNRNITALPNPRHSAELTDIISGRSWSTMSNDTIHRLSQGNKLELRRRITPVTYSGRERYTGRDGARARFNLAKKADAKRWARLSISFVLLFCVLSNAAGLAQNRQIAQGFVNEVLELSFEGPLFGPSDSPARDVDFFVRFTHETGSPEYVVHGFWDGDGQGNVNGNVFKVRFTPTQAGRWNLVEVHSSATELDGQQEGNYITAAESDHPGFWIVDEDSPGRRWYRRSDGSHSYIYGNTHYSFLSGYEAGDRPSGNDISKDIAGNAQYFKKLRFSIHGDRYPHPDEKPFFDDRGRPTDQGDFSHRPNPAWFFGRVDRAVQEAYTHDLIADLILAGPDEETSRSTLRALENGGDPAPFLKYIAARYGSYPNVWITIANEFEIRVPAYSEEEIARFGEIINSYLPYQVPLSVHAHPSTGWSAAFDSLQEWNDHIIIQDKLRHLTPAADGVEHARRKPGGGTREMPVINDELSYQGEGDEHDEGDTIESHLGIFLGGGYGTTGEKPGNKLGQYFRGNFDPSEHTAADNLGWLRELIDLNISFWRMEPDLSIFSSLHEDFRGMAWEGHEYVLGTNRAVENMVVDLPPGRWQITQYDVIEKTEHVLDSGAEGTFIFDSPDSRAVLFHFKRL